MKLTYTAMLIGAVLAATAAGCRKKQDLLPPGPVTSGAPSTGTPTPEPTPGQPAGFRPVAPPRVISRDNRWALPKDDAGAKPDAPAARPAAKVLAYSTDADIARFKEEKARAQTEGAVNTTLGAALPQMKACFDQYGAPSGEVTVSVRVHRTGYVMSSSASGVSGPVGTCLSGVLDRLHVNGVQTDSITVQRTFKFSNRR